MIKVTKREFQNLYELYNKAIPGSIFEVIKVVESVYGNLQNWKDLNPDAEVDERLDRRYQADKKLMDMSLEKLAQMNSENPLLN